MPLDELAASPIERVGIAPQSVRSGPDQSFSLLPSFEDLTRSTRSGDQASSSLALCGLLPISSGRLPGRSSNETGRHPVTISIGFVLPSSAADVLPLRSTWQRSAAGSYCRMPWQ